MMPDYEAMPEDEAYESYRDMKLEQEPVTEKRFADEDGVLHASWCPIATGSIYCECRTDEQMSEGVDYGEPTNRLRIEIRMRRELPTEMFEQAMEAVYELMDEGAAF